MKSVSGKEGPQRVRIPRAARPLLSAVGRCAESQGMTAYAVGGCVRDWLLGTTRTPDLDVAVEGDGIALARAVAQQLGGFCTAHAQFGTATVMRRGGPRLDVATCRTETYARPGAYPRVSPGRIEDDLFRRDFTINAMAAALAPGRFGALADPFGGARDLRRRCLRILHPKSLLDDPSRILRGIRFRHRFGLSWEPATARGLREAMAAGALGWLNRGRLEKELALMQREPDPSACVQELSALMAGAAWAGR